MNEVIDTGLIQKDRLKDIMREILSLEHERNAVKEDMVDVKNHISSFLPKGMFSKALKVYLEKVMTDRHRLIMSICQIYLEYPSLVKCTSQEK